MILALLSLCLALTWHGLVSPARVAIPLHASLEKVTGHLQEMLLYGASPQLLLKTLIDVGRACLRLSASLLLPCFLFLSPLFLGLYVSAGFYQHRAIHPGESVILRAPSGGVWKLEATPEISVEVSEFQHPKLPRTLWRLRPTRAGHWTLSLKGPEGSHTTRPLVARAPSDSSRTWLSPLETSLDYPSGDWFPQRWKTPWWAVFLLAFLLWSALLALLPRRGNRSA